MNFYVTWAVCHFSDGINLTQGMLSFIMCRSKTPFEQETIKMQCVLFSYSFQSLFL